MAGQRLKNFVFGTIATGLSVVLTIALAEAAATAYLTLRDGKYSSAHQRFENADHPWFQGTIDRPTDTYYCKHVDTLFPHPYLGWVYHGNPPCGYPKSINNIGTQRHDFPAQKISDHFVIMLSGGSVATYVGGGNQQFVGGGLHPPYLERALNERWESPDGKPFLVLQGSAGGWKQPQQAIMFMLYANILDAVVTLDGANELTQARHPDGELFEYPFLHFSEVNPLATASFSDVVAQWALSRIITKIRTTPPFSYSSLAFIVADRLNLLTEPDPALKSQWRTTVQGIFAGPKDWTDAQYLDDAIRRNEKYVRAMHAMANEFGVKEAHFLQPLPAIDKVLTSDERAAVGPLDYTDKWRHMKSSLLSLNAEGIGVYDLGDVFKNERESLYVDGRPPGWNDRCQESLGYVLMAERMAEVLAQQWHFKQKAVPTYEPDCFHRRDIANRGSWRALKFTASSLNDAKVTQQANGDVNVHLPGIAWADAAELRPDFATEAKDDVKNGMVAITARVVGGSAAIGVLSPDRSKVLERAQMSAAEAAQQVFVHADDTNHIVVQTTAADFGGQVSITAVDFIPSAAKQ